MAVLSPSVKQAAIRPFTTETIFKLNWLTEANSYNRFRVYRVHARSHHLCRNRDQELPFLALIYSSRKRAEFYHEMLHYDRAI